MPTPGSPSSRPRRRAAQRGVVMIITLLALVLLLVGAVALVKSSNVTTLLSGHLAVKRDLQNQGERGLAAAFAQLTGLGALATEASREANLAAANYAAAALPSNAQGIPNVLIQDSTFTTANFSAGDITDADTGLEIRWVIDRQCANTGAFSSSTCQFAFSEQDKGGSDFLRKPGGEARPLFRITVRVKDTRRNTYSYLQAFARG